MIQRKRWLIGSISVVCIVLSICFYNIYPKELESNSTEVVAFHIESDSIDDITLIKLETILNGIPEIKCYFINKEPLSITALIDIANEKEGFIAYRITQLDDLKVIKVSQLKDLESEESQSMIGHLTSLCDVPAYPERKISKILR